MITRISPGSSTHQSRPKILKYPWLDSEWNCAREPESALHLYPFDSFLITAETTLKVVKDGMMLKLKRNLGSRLKFQENQASRTKRKEPGLFLPSYGLHFRSTNSTSSAPRQPFSQHDLSQAPQMVDDGFQKLPGFESHKRKTHCTPSNKGHSRLNRKGLR